MQGEDGDCWLDVALERHEAALMRYAASIVGAGAAADVVQDTFLALCTASREKVEGRLGPWLFLVCKRCALDWLRKHHRLAPLDEALVVDDRAAEATLALERQRSLSCLSGLVDELPERQRQAVILRFSGGLSYKQIAEVMDLSVNYVGVILHTALGRLRARWVEPSDLSSGRSL